MRRAVRKADNAPLVPRPPAAAEAAAARDRRNGFTLVELLVVIAIILLLIALVSPTLSTARERGRTVMCLSQLRQIAVGFVAYADDNGGVPIPAIMPDSTAPRGGYWWPTSLREYLGDRRILFCPSTRVSPPPRMGTLYSGQRDLSWSDGAQFPAAANRPEESSYGHNMWVSDWDRSLNPWGWKGRYPRPLHYTRLSDIDVSTRTPLFADSSWVGAWPDSRVELPRPFEITQPMGPGSWNDRLVRFALTRHNRRDLNVVFADGHASTIRPHELWLLNWHRGAVPRNVTIPWE